ncbi:MAG: hypothetical protein LBQ52_03220 [Helicobacteraceae bacterium]|jgi:hypothetical protein|nr:hypothetical protein [Helicobacteraceae bacterium]
MKLVLAALLALGLSCAAIANDDSLPKNCKQTKFEGWEVDYLFGYTCFYPNKTIAQVYADYRSAKEGDVAERLRKVWKEKLAIDANLSYEVALFDDEPENKASLSYIWRDKNEVEVNLYLGSEETYTFRRKKDGVEVEYLFSRD